MPKCGVGGHHRNSTSSPWTTWIWRSARDFGYGSGREDHRHAVFRFYGGAGARLERALINFMLDVHTHDHGYRGGLFSFMANATSLFGTGNLPKFDQDLFKIEGIDYYLIPTAEVPVTNIYQGEVIDGSLLPVKYVAYTPCFRSEAGSYGKDTRGLIRQHQFNKVELVKFAEPASSYDELEALYARC